MTKATRSGHHSTSPNTSFETDHLEPVPEYRLGADGLCEDTRYWEWADRLLANAARQFGRSKIALGDHFSRRWLQRCGAPMLEELDRIASRVHRPGVYFLNLSYEWACTTALLESAGGVRMLRSFDWGHTGLGGSLCLLRRSTRTGPWVSVTWPMFVGEVMIVAPRRFAIALNRAPVRPRRFLGRGAPEFVGRPLNWLDLWRSRAIPPAYLLRRVAEQAENAGEAISMLMNSPICRSTIFCVGGRTPSESGFIERLPESSRFIPAPASIANHWLSSDWPGVTTESSRSRLAALNNLLDDSPSSGPEPFAWCVPPILNETTHYAAEVDLAQPSFTVVAFESSVPARRVTVVPFS